MKAACRKGPLLSRGRRHQHETGAPRPGRRIAEGAGADHLKALSRVARMTRDPANMQKLRSARDEATLRTLLAQDPVNHAA